MSRLRVGDISIDGSNVTIGGVNPAAPVVRPPAGSAPSDVQGPIRLLDRIPFSPGFLVMTGVAVAAVGTLINLWMKAWLDPIGALLAGGALAPLGVGVVALGAAKGLLRRRPAVRHQAALGGSPEPYLATLRSLLALDRPEQTVPWIARRTGWSDEQVVHALALLRASDELREEIDLDTGEFYYVSQPSRPTLGPRDLDTRLGDLTP